MATVKNKDQQHLPEFFEPLFWDIHFSSVNPETDARRILERTINHGEWRHWLWIFRYYGKEKLRRMIHEIPETEFRKPALKLISLFLGIKKMKYASRSDYIKSKKAFGKAKKFS